MDVATLVPWAPHQKLTQTIGVPLLSFGDTDGNKRTGFMAAYTFLRRNGMHLVTSQADAVQAVLALASSEMTEQQFARWLEANSRPVT